MPIRVIQALNNHRNFARNSAESKRCLSLLTMLMVSPFTEGYNKVQKGITTAVTLKVKVINNISVPLLGFSKVMWGLR